VDHARTLAGIEDVIITAKEGQRLEPPPEGSSYPGFIFARGISPGDIDVALRAANACLHFKVSTSLPVVK